MPKPPKLSEISDQIDIKSSLVPLKPHSTEPNVSTKELTIPLNNDLKPIVTRRGRVSRPSKRFNELQSTASADLGEDPQPSTSKDTRKRKADNDSAFEGKHIKESGTLRGVTVRTKDRLRTTSNFIEPDISIVINSDKHIFIKEVERQKQLKLNLESGENLTPCVDCDESLTNDHLQHNCGDIEKNKKEIANGVEVKEGEYPLKNLTGSFIPHCIAIKLEKQDVGLACDKCGAKFTQAQIETGEPCCTDAMIHCTYCERPFTHDEVHDEMTHTCAKHQMRKYIYKCTLCNEYFKYRCQIIKHYKIHAKEKRVWKCSKCYKICATESKYKTHSCGTRPSLSESTESILEQTLHRPKGRPLKYPHVDTSVENRCQRCDNLIGSRTSLLRHLRTCRVNCEICGDQVMSASVDFTLDERQLAMKAHQCTVPPNAFLECDECTMKVKFWPQMIFHKNRNHNCNYGFEEKHFTSHRDFNEWREQYTLNTGFRFSQAHKTHVKATQRAHKSTLSYMLGEERPADWVVQETYRCVNTFRNKTPNPFAAIGVNKIDADKFAGKNGELCLAYLEAVICEDGRTVVKMQLKHSHEAMQVATHVLPHVHYNRRNSKFVNNKLLTAEQQEAILRVFDNAGGNVAQTLREIQYRPELNLPQGMTRKDITNLVTLSYADQKELHINNKIMTIDDIDNARLIEYDQIFDKATGIAPDESTTLRSNINLTKLMTPQQMHASIGQMAAYLGQQAHLEYSDDDDLTIKAAYDYYLQLYRIVHMQIEGGQSSCNIERQVFDKAERLKQRAVELCADYKLLNPVESERLARQGIEEIHLPTPDVMYQAAVDAESNRLAADEPLPREQDDVSVIELADDITVD